MISINEMMRECRQSGQPCSRFARDYKEEKEGDYLIVLAVTRDSDTLERSNFESAKLMLEKVGVEGSDFSIERHGHWLCGWIDYLTVNPNRRAAVVVARGIGKDLERYPILDELHFSDLEYNEFYEIIEQELEEHEIDDFIEFMQDSNHSYDPEDAFFAIEEFKEAQEQVS